MSLANPSAAAPRPAGPGTAPSVPVAAPRAFCRAALPRVSRTFALNIQLLGGSMQEAVRIAYLLCRIADTIEDAWPGERAEVERRFDQFLAAVKGDTLEARAFADAAPRLRGHASEAHIDLLAHTPDVLRAFGTLHAEDRAPVAEAVGTLASGMRRYAGRAAERRDSRPAPADGARAVATFAYLDDDAELTDYCWVVAGCVGAMLTRLFERRAPNAAHHAARIALSPTVGEALQLTNILLDWPVDVRAGRCHVPASWLAEFGLEPRDLVGAPRPEVATLATRLETRAGAALAKVPDYIATIPSRHVRYRMFCLWPALWAAASLRNATRDAEFPRGPARPRLPKSELWAAAAAALTRGHSAAGVSALFASLGVPSR